MSLEVTGESAPISTTESAMAVLRKDQAEHDEVCLHLSAQIGKRIAPDLYGVFGEHRTAYARYKAIIAMVEQVAVGDADTAELTCRNYKQTGPTGAILPLETFMSTKLQYIREYESVAGIKVSEGKKAG